MDFNKILEEIKANLLALVNKKFFEYKKEGKKDMEAFIKQSEEKLKRWTKALENKDIDLDDFEWLVKSQKDLLVMNVLYQTGISKIKLGHFKNSVVKTIIKTVSDLVLNKE